METKQALIFSESSKNLHDYMFIIPDKKSIFENKNLTPVSRVWETVFLEKIRFGGNFVVIACVAACPPLLMFFEAILATLMEILFLQLTFNRETKPSAISSEVMIPVMIVSRFLEKSQQYSGL